MPTALRSGAGASSILSAGGFRPARTGNLVAAAVDTTDIALTWDAADPLDEVTGYVVERSNDGVSGWASVGTPGTNAFTDSTLGAGIHRYYRVSAVNAAGQGAASTVADAWTLPGQVTGASATAISNSEIDLGWSAVTGAATYQVQRSKDQATWTLVGTVGTPGFNNTNGLLPGTQYFYRIRAVDPAGPGAWSATVNATTSAGTNTLRVSLTLAYALNEVSGNFINLLADGQDMTRAGSPGQTTGRCGVGASFNGTTSYAIHNDTGASDPTRFGAGRAFTLAFVYNPTTVAAGTEYILGKGALNNANSEIQIARNGADIEVFLRNAGVAVLSTTGDLRVGVDNLVIVSWDPTGNGTAKVRVNCGKDNFSVNANLAPIESGAPFTVGRATVHFGTGSVRGIFKWDRYISADEEMYLFNGGLWRDFASVYNASVVPIAPSTPLTRLYSAGVWGDAAHNSFTSIAHLGTHFILAFREAALHGYSADAKYRILRCLDTDDPSVLGNWSLAATLTSYDGTRLDVREPKLVVRPSDGKLLLFSAVSSAGNADFVSSVWTSDDGVTWDAGQALSGPALNDWLWSPAYGPDAKGYCVAQAVFGALVRLYRTHTPHTGLVWELLVDPLDGPDVNGVDEASLYWTGAGQAVSIIRRETSAWDRMATAVSPFTAWTVTNTQPSQPSAKDSRAQSPFSLLLNDGRAVTAGRGNQGGGQSTYLYWTEPETRSNVPFLFMEAADQTESGYPGVVEFNGSLIVSFYSTVSLGGDNPAAKRCVRICKVPVPQ